MHRAQSDFRKECGGFLPRSLVAHEDLQIEVQEAPRPLHLTQVVRHHQSQRRSDTNGASNSTAQCFANPEELADSRSRQEQDSEFILTKSTANTHVQSRAIQNLSEEHVLDLVQARVFEYILVTVSQHVKSNVNDTFLQEHVIPSQRMDGIQIQTVWCRNVSDLVVETGLECPRKQEQPLYLQVLGMAKSWRSEPYEEDASGRNSRRQARRCLMSCNVVGEQVLREGLQESLRNLYDEKVDLESIFSAFLEISGGPGSMVCAFPEEH
ncbi:hypothetical protein KCU61_g309, partial [Aureobasidium melanogenum]